MLDLMRDIKHILNCIDGLLIVDDKERLVFMANNLIEDIHEREENIMGKRLRDVIYSNMTYKVLETGQRQIGVTYLVNGRTIIANGYPIYKQGKLIGALEYDVFENIDLLESFFDRITEKKEIYHFGQELHKPSKTKYGLDSIKGSSSAIIKMKEEIQFAAKSNSTVLISGETGSGKELIAQSIHSESQRRLFDYVDINCAAIPNELFESEIFGYEEGSFTGAKKGGKKGKAEIADKGTLVLDEVNSLSMQMQAKLLRFLQEKEVSPIGSTKSVPVDVRIIALTNQDLKQMVDAGEFREDLYYRLNVIEISSVPLRKRKSDIPELVNYFISQLNKTLGRNLEATQIRDVDNAVLKMLVDYNWPGNVRELQNVVERAMNHCYGSTLKPEHFDNVLMNKILKDMGSTDEIMTIRNLKELKKQLEIYAIKDVLSRKQITYIEAAKILGISRQMLHRKIIAYGLEPSSEDTESRE